jgi:hypothetical protein
MIPATIRNHDFFTSQAQLSQITRNRDSGIHIFNKHKQVNIGISKFGKGLFATENIRRGSIITNVSGSAMKFEEAASLGEKESYPFQVGLSEYICPNQHTIWQYINHCCEPNCGVNENFEIIAIRNIKNGEELFYDYSTTMLEKHWTMKCLCNKQSCRHIIADFDTLLPETQQYYLNKGVVQQFIKQFLKTINSKQTLYET